MEVVLTLFFYLIIIFATSYSMKRIIRKGKKTHYNRIVIVTIIISLISAMRGKLGTDTQMYIDAYMRGTDSISRWVDFEIGFKFIVNVFAKLGVSYQVFFFLVSFATMLLAFLIIEREKDNINVFLAVLLCMIDFYFLSWNTMRQALAITMSIFGLCLFLDKKRKIGTIFIVLASLFHTSALVSLVVIVADYVFETKRYKFVLGIATLLSIYLVFHRELISKIVYSITHVSYYAQYFSRTAETEGSIFTYYLKILPILMVTILGYKAYEQLPKYRVFFSLMLLGYIFSSIGAITDTQIQRIGYYFIYLVWLVAGRVGSYGIKVGKRKYLTGKQVTYLLVAYELILFIFNRFIKGYGELVPYPWFEL